MLVKKLITKSDTNGAELRENIIIIRQNKTRAHNTLAQDVLSWKANCPMRTDLLYANSKQTIWCFKLLY